MPRRKQIKIDAVRDFPNVFQVSKEEECEMRGQWCKEYFGNDGELVLELGCGHGQYVLSLSEIFPEKNFIGVDLKGSRIWSGSKRAKEAGAENTAFIVSNIQYIDNYFSEGEVDEIWVTFPDPFPKPSKASRRLISPFYLEIYKKILKKGGRVHFKTDNEALFDYALEHIQADTVYRDIHGVEGEAISANNPLLQIETFYEKKFKDLGQKIFYMNFTL